MPITRQIALNNNVGAFVNITALGAPRVVEMQEDEAAATQGLQTQSILDNFATTNVFSFSSEPLSIPNILRYPAAGPLLGMIAQGVVGTFNYIAARILVKARSNGAAGTTLRFIENE